MSMQQEIESGRAAIKAALSAGNMDLALVLTSKVVGLRICVGEIPTKLRRRADA